MEWEEALLIADGATVKSMMLPLICQLAKMHRKIRQNYGKTNRSPGH
jgi:hypothetical protein